MNDALPISVVHVQSYTTSDAETKEDDWGHAPSDGVATVHAGKRIERDMGGCKGRQSDGRNVISAKANEAETRGRDGAK